MTAKKDDDKIDLKKKLEEARKEEKEKREKEEEKIAEEDAPLRQKLEEMTELAKRTMADMQNMKRRMEEERSTVFTMAIADFIKKILPILDNLDRAAEHMPKDAGDWYKGIEMSLKDLHKILEESGLTRMETVGQNFDPNLHEAVMQGPGEQNIITEELEAGYMLGDRVIRHAKVKVGNGEKE